MTLPPVIRIFFAIDLPEDVKKNIGTLISVLKKQAHTPAIRWSRFENLHITLQFLGEMKSDDLPGLIKSVRYRVEEKLPSISLILGTLRLFPNPYRPRVIVLETGPQAALANLAATIGEAIQASNYRIDERPFRAHLTLGRIKHPQNLHLHFLSEISVPRQEKIAVNEVTLFRSEPQPTGLSKYTVLEKIQLITPRVKA